MYGPTEVCDLEFTSQTHQQVLWFNVSVNHLLTVTVHQRIRQLGDKLEPQNIHFTTLSLLNCENKNSTERNSGHIAATANLQCANKMSQLCQK